MKKFYHILILMMLIGLSNCSPNIKPHHRQFVNDPDMRAGKGASFSSYVHSIREASNPITNPKASGGCGCN